MDFPFLSYCRVMESTWIHKAMPVCHVFGRVLPKCPLGGADGLKCLKYLWAIYSHLTMCSPCMKKVRKFQVSEFWVLYCSQPDISRFTPRLVWTILDFWQSAVTWECMASRPGLDQFQQVPGPCFWLCMTQKSFWITSKQFEKNKQITLKTKKNTPHNIGLRFEGMPICQSCFRFQTPCLKFPDRESIPRIPKFRVPNHRQSKNLQSDVLVFFNEKMLRCSPNVNLRVLKKISDS